MIGGTCLNLNLGLTFNRDVAFSIVFILASLVAGVFVYKAKKEKFVENEFATIEPKSDEEMKEYMMHVAIKIFPFCFYAPVLKFICRLLNTYVFNG